MRLPKFLRRRAHPDTLTDRQIALYTAMREALPLLDGLPEGFAALCHHELMTLRLAIHTRDIQRIYVRNALSRVLDSARWWQKTQCRSLAVARLIARFAPLLEESHRIADALAAEAAVTARRARAKRG